MLAPWLREPCELKLMEEFLKRIRPESILEWGAGGSTTLYPGWCPPVSRWIAIESDLEWVNKVKDNLPKDRNIEVYHVPCDAGTDESDKNSWLRNTWYSQYVSYPDKFNLKFDLIYIDGRARHNCLDQALKYSHENTLIAHHDCCDQVHIDNVKSTKNIEIIETFGAYWVLRYKL